MGDLNASLRDARYISLTTYRRDGRSVATPVWFVLDGERILVWTDAASGKAKRIRANGRASVAACDARGKPRGLVFEATARVLPDTDFTRSNGLVSDKYRLAKPLVELWTRVTHALRRKPRPAEVYLEVTAVAPAMETPA